MKNLTKFYVMQKKMTEILLKKRMVYQTKLNKLEQRRLLYHKEMRSINTLYTQLRKKLEKEWEDKISQLEQNKIINLQEKQKIDLTISEIDKFLQQYNLLHENDEKLQRWALDKNIFSEF